MEPSPPPFRTHSVQSATECPSDGRLAALLEGHLDPIEADHVLEHADGCEACRELVAALGRGARTIDAAQTQSDGDAPPPEPAVGDRIGRYVVTGVLGRGGMGVVVRARDPELDREVALKLVRSKSGTRGHELRARQIREAQALARLNHPHVVPIFDVGEWGGRTFIACERVRGRNLRAHLAHARPPWRHVLDLILQAGRGLAAVHAAGLVHRDIKPDNVLVGDDGRARLADFGLVRDELPSLDTQSDSHDSRVQSPTLTRHGEVLGTPAYMAPEQHTDRDVDARADQYAFCVTAYEALLGTRPFAGSTLVELLEQQLAGRIAPPSDTRRLTVSCR